MDPSPNTYWEILLVHLHTKVGHIHTEVHVMGRVVMKVTDLELSLGREDSEFHLLELQEGVRESLCCCQPVLRVGHQ